MMEILFWFNYESLLTATISYQLLNLSLIKAKHVLKLIIIGFNTVNFCIKHFFYDMSFVRKHLNGSSNRNKLHIFELYRMDSLHFIHLSSKSCFCFRQGLHRIMIHMSKSQEIVWPRHFHRCGTRSHKLIYLL